MSKPVCPRCHSEKIETAWSTQEQAALKCCSCGHGFLVEVERDGTYQMKELIDVAERVEGWEPILQSVKPGS